MKRETMQRKKKDFRKRKIKEEIRPRPYFIREPAPHPVFNCTL